MARTARPTIEPTAISAIAPDGRLELEVFALVVVELDGFANVLVVDEATVELDVGPRGPVVDGPTVMVDVGPDKVFVTVERVWTLLWVNSAEQPLATLDTSNA
jgi:hypothetical protein